MSGKAGVLMKCEFKTQDVRQEKLKTGVLEAFFHLGLAWLFQVVPLALAAVGII